MITQVQAWQCTDGTCHARKEDAVRRQRALDNTKIYTTIRELVVQHFEANVRDANWREFTIDNALNAIIDNSSLVSNLLKDYNQEV